MDGDQHMTFCNTCKCFRPADSTINKDWKLGVNVSEATDQLCGFGYCTRMNEFRHYYNTCYQPNPSIHPLFSIEDPELERDREIIYDTIVLRRILRHIRRLHYDSNGNLEMMMKFIPNIKTKRAGFTTDSPIAELIDKPDTINGIDYHALVADRLLDKFV